MSMRACIIPGRERSLEKCSAPVTLETPSFLGVSLPMTLYRLCPDIVYDSRVSAIKSVDKKARAHRDAN